MNFINFYILLIISIHCSAGPLEDIANMPDLTLFYQQLMRQQDIQMLLQGLYPQQQAGGINDFTIFAPNNEAMTRLSRKNEDLNLLWKYHIVSGRYDEQILSNMAQEKFNQVNPRQMMGFRVQNNLPTIAIPFQIFYGLGFYGGTGPQVNETYDNAGYGFGGISWLTQTSINQTNLYDTNVPINPFLVNNYNPNQNYIAAQGSLQSGNPNLFPQNLTNYYNNVFNPQYSPNPNYNPYLQQQNYGQIGSNGGIGILRPTINNAFILQSRPMSRGIINVIDNILWPPERRDQSQYRTAYDALEDAQFSRLRQLAERSDFFRSELRAMHHQTWFLPNDQAFASIGSSLSFLLDQSYVNNTNDINEFIRAHVIPLVMYPCAMDSTKQITTLSANKWITFRKISQPDQSFQLDVISGRHVARILVSRPEDIRLYGNGIVYPISTFLSTQARIAADELFRSYQYFMTLIQQSGDLELIGLLQGSTNQNIYNSQNLFNITVLIPQQSSIQQLGTAQELSMNLRRHILRFPVYVDQLAPMQAMPNSFAQQNIYRTGQQQQKQPLNPQQNPYPTEQKQQPPQQPLNPQQNIYQTGQQQQQQQQSLNPQQNPYPTGQQPLNPQQNPYLTGQQPLNPQKNPYPTGQQPFNPQQNIYQTGQQQQLQQPLNPQQQPLIPQQNIYQTGQQQKPLNPQQNIYQTGQQQQPFIQPGFNQQQQQFQMPQLQRAASGSDKKLRRRRRQMNIPPNTNFQPQQFPQQQLPNQQMLPNQQQQILPNPQQQLPNQQMLPNQQQQILPNPQQQLPNQQMLPNQQQQLPNQQMLPNQQQQLPNQQVLLTQQQQFNPINNPISSFPSSAIFQDGQVYPTMDPQFSIQAQVSAGPNGNIVTLVGRSSNTLPFSATILNSESNIPIKNGVMHVIRGILSGTILPLEGVLSSVQGASAFSQLLQQTGIINQLKQSGRPYTLFIPTNAALQSIGVSSDMNRLTRFVQRHICTDVLLDPTNNVLRRSAGFYNRAQNLQRQRSRRRRQDWMNNRQNLTNRQGLPSPDLGPGYFQPQQQVYGGYPAAPSPFGSNNQLYNPGYVMNGYASPNSEYFPSYNGTYLGSQNFNYNNLGVPKQPNNPWNGTIAIPFNPQINNGRQNFYPSPDGYGSGSAYTRGPQSCMAMTGERITVQPLAGTQPEGNTPSMSYQNFMVTCCGDQSVHSLVQSFNIYPPNFAVYLIGRSLLSQGQTLNSMYNYTSKLLPSHMIIFFFIISIIFKEQIHHL